MRIISFVIGLLTLLAAPVWAQQNQAYQNYFFGVCGGSPTGSLSTRCGETPGGTGDLSGDSEVSLNPNQGLAAQDSARSQARQLSNDVGERLAARRAEDTDTAPPVGFFMNGRYTSVDRTEHSESSSLQAQPLQEERGYETDEGSIQVGADYRLSDAAIIGALFAYTRGSTEFDGDESSDPTFNPALRSGDYEADSYFFSLFGSLDLGSGLSLDGSFGGGVSRNELRRDVVFQETTRMVSQTRVRTVGKPDGNEVSVTAGLAYDRDWESLSFGTYLRARYIRTHLDGYRESDRTGSGLAMRFDEQTRHSATSILGVRGSYAISTDFGVLIPSVRVEWEHEYALDALKTDQQLISDAAGNGYSLRGQGPDRNYANIAAGITAVLPGGWMLFSEYEALLGYRDLSRHRVTAGFRAEF